MPGGPAVTGGTTATASATERASHPAIWRHGLPAAARERALAEEVAVALTYNRETYAVMMATPADLADFAVGFSLSEGVVARAGDIEELGIVAAEHGIEARLWLAPARLAAVRARRRRLAGPTGCGLCGIDSLREAVRPAASIGSAATFTAADIALAQRAMEAMLPLGAATHAAHAAALWHPARGILHVREDVGRHNALDKLIGAAARAGDDARGCMALLSSRVSIDMVQKACVLAAPVLVAVSAPTAHAVRLAEAAALTLVAVARADGFEVFSAAYRIT